MMEITERGGERRFWCSHVFGSEVFFKKKSVSTLHSLNDICKLIACVNLIVQAVILLQMATGKCWHSWNVDNT